jgi:N-acetyl-1-D-myo-inositol-2-amino-2-deoxy-alpha-D-glucopyranoside deacetylase
VRAVVDELRPDIVVTLDASDGHRDHAAIRDATVAAVDRARNPPAATYLWCLARSSMARWAEHVQGSSARAYSGELGTPDDDITTVVDVSGHLAKRWEAIRAHASQASPYNDLPPDLQHEFLATDRLRLVRGDDVLAR